MSDSGMAIGASGDSAAWSSQPMLSVVLPNYNHARLIPRAIEALYAQVPPPGEVIVVDDGSTDDSLAVIAAHAERHPTLRVIVHPANQGAIATLAHGLEASRGSHVYFAAADDWVDPGFFAAALAMLWSYPQAGLCCGEARLVDGHTGETVARRPPVRPIYRAGFVDAHQTRGLLRRLDNWILTGSAVFRRDAAVAAGGFDARMGSFADGYMARKVALTHGFCFIPQVVATWCVYPDSYSRRTALDAARAQSALETVPAALAADPIFPPWYAQVFAGRWRFAVARLAVSSGSINRQLLLSMGAQTKFDQFMLNATSRLPLFPLARLTTLAWLWFRLRPTTLSGLLRTALARRIETMAGPFVRYAKQGRQFDEQA